MTPLGERLRRKIAADGPVALTTFMATCLLDPEHGYYATRDPFGQGGDFTTAPEISQMFGEMLGLWVAQVWIDRGCPAPFTLVELGPGRGTLMSDALRAAGGVPGFSAAVRPVLVEASQPLRALQKAAVPSATHVTALREVRFEGPAVVIANEFFDALPIRQFQRLGDGWGERMVALDGDALTLSAGAPRPHPGLDLRFPAIADGTIVEVNEGAESICAALARQGATLLAIDYGSWEGTGDTFQALAGHRPVDPFAAPGEADLTSHVGFRWLAEAGKPLRAQFSAQGAFLAALGIGQRAAGLAREGDADAIADALERLTDADQMGTLFKVLALSPEDTPPTPGFGS